MTPKLRAENKEKRIMPGDVVFLGITSQYNVYVWTPINQGLSRDQEIDMINLLNKSFL